MAERVSRKTAKAKKPKSGKIRGKRKGKAAGPPPAGDNSEKFQGVPMTVWRKHMPLVAKAELQKDKDRETARSSASRYRDALRAAKDDGLPPEAIILARKLDKKDHGEMLQLYADVSTALNVMGSNLGTKQLDLFGHLDSRRGEDVPADPVKEGFAAGKRGDRADNNPYIPGGDEYEAYANAWREGQAELAGGIGKSGPQSIN